MIAAAAFVFAGLIAAGCFGALRWQARSFDRRERVYLDVIRDLNDRLMHLAGRPMPATVGEPADVPTRQEASGLILDPEHYGDLYEQSDRLDSVRPPDGWPWNRMRNGDEPAHPQPSLEELT